MPIIEGFILGLEEALPTTIVDHNFQRKSRFSDYNSDQHHSDHSDQHHSDHSDDDSRESTPGEKSPKTKFKHRRGREHQSKICGICGDVAKSFHFGGLSCDSCKAFFRRAVQNYAYKHYQCAYEGHCEVTESTRKCCQYCRFRKCRKIGMEPGWVMTEEERQQMHRSRLERQQRQREEATKELEYGDHHVHSGLPYRPRELDAAQKFLRPEEMLEVKALAARYHQAEKRIPFQKLLTGINDTEALPQMLEINLFSRLTILMAHCAQMIPSFASLPSGDRQILLRGAILKMIFLRSALSFDREGQQWSTSNHPSNKNIRKIKVDSLDRLMSSELLELLRKFINSLQELCPDEYTIMLLMVVVLFAPEAQGLTQPDKVTQAQNTYVILMRKYLEWHYGAQSSTLMYPKLLTKLADLQELSDLHTPQNLRLQRKEVRQLQEELGRLQLNPYTQFDIMNATVLPPQLPAEPISTQCIPKLQYFGRMQHPQIFPVPTFEPTASNSLDSVKRNYMLSMEDTVNTVIKRRFESGIIDSLYAPDVKRTRKPEKIELQHPHPYYSMQENPPTPYFRPHCQATPSYIEYPLPPAENNPEIYHRNNYPMVPAGENYPEYNFVHTYQDLEAQQPTIQQLEPIYSQRSDLLAATNGTYTPEPPNIVPATTQYTMNFDLSQTLMDTDVDGILHLFDDHH